MTQVVTVEKKILDSILSQLTQVKKELKSLRRTVEDLTPEYGSESWWEKETKEALEEVKKGNVVKFDTIEELIHDLHS